MDETIQRAIGESIAEVSEATGEEIYLVEADIRGGGRSMELAVDTDRGISIDQCARLSRLIRGRLEGCQDNLLLAAGDFELMVSSPGIGEPIRVQRQYLRHLGRLLRITRIDAGGQRTEIDGRLLEASFEAGREPSITIQPVMAGKKKRSAIGQLPLTLQLADVVKAVVQTEW
ncbi:MAG: ribosome maturation factor RimP [Chlorobiaceae bacterium]|jgi:ribosome maturation factor RimP|nr:ribosome maturation factor RimP [Chlorobiaceae bacterium]